jgi:leucyl aminopeptidase
VTRPLNPIYDRQITTRFADVKNIGGRTASPVTAARFLARFVEEYPWAHMDIAGTSWWERDLPYPLKPYYVRGNTGISVGTLVGVLRAWNPS